MSWPAKHPGPWRCEFDEIWPAVTDQPILDANGEAVVVTDSGCYPPDPETARFIVDAVNERDDLVENLKTANANRERESAIWAKLVTELKAERDRAVKFADAAPHPGSATWKEMRAVYVERDRMRDLVGRLAQRIQFARLSDPNPGGEDPLLREAAAVLGEEVRT